MTTTCPVCYDDDKKLVVLADCAHGACESCLRTWFQTCVAGEATCPRCRRRVDSDEIVCLFGAPVASSTPTSKANEGSVPVDELTSTWLSENGAQQCRHCKIWIVREDGCDAMACLCGYRFCWTCMDSESDCQCGHSAEDYFDNILRREYSQSRVATGDELLDLRAFIESYREQEIMEQTVTEAQASQGEASRPSTEQASPADPGRPQDIQDSVQL